MFLREIGGESHSKESGDRGNYVFWVKSARLGRFGQNLKFSNHNLAEVIWSAALKDLGGETPYPAPNNVRQIILKSKK